MKPKIIDMTFTRASSNSYEHVTARLDNGDQIRITIADTGELKITSREGILIVKPFAPNGITITAEI